MSLGEDAPLSERKRPCVPRPALFALFGALLWAVVGLTATVATLSAAEVEVTRSRRSCRRPAPRAGGAQRVAPAAAQHARRQFRQGFFCPTPSRAPCRAADAAAAKAIRDDVTAGVIGHLQLEVQLDDLYE